MEIYSDISQITNISQFKKKAIFSVDSFIFINDKKLFAHKDDINSMICD